MKHKIKFFLLMSMLWYSKSMTAICPLASFKLTVSNNTSTQCFIITADYTSRIACTGDISGTQTVRSFFGADILNVDACGLYVTTNICYTIRPLDWTNGQDIFTIKILSTTGWNNNLSINYNYLTHQFAVATPGNTSLYQINQCRFCTNDKVIAANASFFDPLTESGTWIETTENLSGNSVVINPTSDVIFDADSSAYIRFKSGFVSQPTTGTFTARVGDGCGPGIPGATNVNLGLILQGYSNGGQTMRPVLMNQGVSTNPLITDVVHVELRDNITPFNKVAEADAVVNTNGILKASFPPIDTGNLYIVVNHRNTIETWSAVPVYVSPSNPSNYDFTTAASKAYGANQVQASPGVWAFYSGEIIQDENIDLLDLSILEDGINNFGFGYLSTDINGDGNVDLLDVPIVETNLNNFIFSAHP